MNNTYADTFRIFGSLTDIKLDFATTQPCVDENGNIIGEEHSNEHRIILSLPLAKNLAAKLSATVEDYEKNFGAVLDMIALQETNEEN